MGRCCLPPGETVLLSSCEEIQEPMDRRVVIITGASSGIGAAVAREAVRKGFAVVLAARRTERIEALAAELRQAGGDALAVTTDISRLDDQRRLVEETLHAFGRIDIL